MLNSISPTHLPTRVSEVDAIRGLALFGICVVNVPFLAQPLEALMTPPVHRIDVFAQGLVEWLFQGKFFVLFSFLFGWGFALQMRSGERAGADPQRRFLRRLIALAAIGIAHAALVFFGDILLLYAVLGLPLLALREASPRMLLRIAVASLTVAAVVFLAMAIASEVVASVDRSPASGAGYLGGPVDVVRQRLRDWPFAFAFIAAFNGPLAFAAFCAGSAAAKVGFFEPGNLHYSRLRGAIPRLLPAALVLNLFYMLAVNGTLGDGLWAAFAFSALALGGPALAAVYLVGIVELARSGRLRGATVAAGRMSLSAYILEGIFAGLIFNGYGLGLYGTIGAFGCLCLAVAIYAATHLFAVLWLRAFAQGPLEWLLRRITRSAAARPDHS